MLLRLFIIFSVLVSTCFATTDAAEPMRIGVLSYNHDTLSGRVLERFKEQWTVAGSEELPTIPVGEPKRQIDFILYRPACRWRVIEVRVLDEAVASDHRAIFSMLELLPPEG